MTTTTDKPIYSDTHPTEPGWYWWRSTRFRGNRWDEQPVEVFATLGGGLLFTKFGAADNDYLHGEWGPRIEPPRQEEP